MAATFLRLGLFLPLSVWLLVALLGATAATAGAQETSRAVGSSDEVRLARGTVIIAGIDPHEGQLAVLEMLVLQNGGEAPYLPARWEESAIRIAVPAGTQDVTIASGPAGAQLVPVTGGYALASPLPPGEHTLVVSYRLGYGVDRAAGGGTATLTLAKTLPLAARRFQMLVPDIPGLDVRPLGLVQEAAESAVVGGQRYHVLVGRELPAGADASVELRGLPVLPQTPGPAAPVGVPERLDGAVLLLMAALLGAGLVYGRRYRSPAAILAQPGRIGLAEGLAALQRVELEHAAGRLGNADYEVARVSLKARLAWLARSGAVAVGRRELLRAEDTRRRRVRKSANRSLAVGVHAGTGSRPESG